MIRILGIVLLAGVITNFSSVSAMELAQRVDDRIDNRQERRQDAV